MKEKIKELLESNDSNNWKLAIILIQNLELKYDDLLELLKVICNKETQYFKEKYLNLKNESIASEHKVISKLLSRFLKILEDKSAETIEITDKTGRE